MQIIVIGGQANLGNARIFTASVTATPPLAFLVPYSFQLFPYPNVRYEDEVDVESGP